MPRQIPLSMLAPLFLTTFLAATLVTVPVAAQVAEVPSARVSGTFDKSSAALEQRQLALFLLAQEGKAAPVGLLAEPAEKELQRLADAPDDEGRLLVGIVHPLQTAVRFDDLDAKASGEVSTAHEGGVLRLGQEGFVWFTRVRSRDATAVRLHLADLSLPPGAELWIYSRRGEAFGPYTGRGPAGDGELWTHTVAGPEVRLQVRYFGPQVERALAATELVVADVVHLGSRFLLAEVTNPLPGPGDFLPGGFPDENPDKGYCWFSASCVRNASCSSIPDPVRPARDAVAHIQFVVGASTYVCSGGLLNDSDPTTEVPYFLTANHCIDSPDAAATLEAYFQFSTGCGEACYTAHGAVPRVLGATFLAGSSTSDYTLLRLDESPPAGSVLLGWTADAVAFADGAPLHRLSHPKAAPQAYSKHRVDTSKGTCSVWPRGDWIYSHDVLGATEGGSSGSPVLDGQGRVVGQLSGACGLNPTNPCAAEKNATVDGALAAYFPAVKRWLDPGTSCHQGEPGSWDYCTPECPCDAGVGDCDSNAECGAGLECVEDVGANYGWRSKVDVCEPVGCNAGTPGSSDHCSAECPCDDGKGDCDRDADCGAGLECVENVGLDYGWKSWVDVCESAPSDPGPNSCVGFCGSQAPGGCWCDRTCATFGDCCSDRQQVCG